MLRPPASSELHFTSFRECCSRHWFHDGDGLLLATVAGEWVVGNSIGWVRCHYKLVTQVNNVICTVSSMPLLKLSCYVKNDVYKNGYRRRSCTSKTAKKSPFCQICSITTLPVAFCWACSVTITSLITVFINVVFYIYICVYLFASMPKLMEL